MEISEAVVFVSEIADTHPITEIYPMTNGCRFCGNSWAEDTYQEYLDNEAKLKIDPEARQPNCWHRIANEHHDPDCLWIKANRIIK